MLFHIDLLQYYIGILIVYTIECLLMFHAGDRKQNKVIANTDFHRTSKRIDSGDSFQFVDTGFPFEIFKRSRHVVVLFYSP